MPVEWQGLDDLDAALTAMADRVQMMTPRIATSMARIAVARGRAKLTETEHDPGTPTPAPPDSPPSKISGHLSGSFTATPPFPSTAGAWTSLVGATAVYARIHELGGWTGRDHASYLPPRPYLKPTYDDLVGSSELIDTAAQLWGRAITG